jgi:hypothetical protein
MMPMGSGIRNQIAARSRMSFGKIWMISPCTCLAHQRWPVVKFGQHIAGMMRPLARPMNPRLEHSTWIVVAAGGDRHMTSRDARSMVMSHNEAFERRSPGHRCAMSAHVRGRRGAEGHGSRDRTIAMPMATVMCMPKLRPSPAPQPPSVLYTNRSSRKMLMTHRTHEHVLIPLCPLHRQKIVVSGCPLPQKVHTHMTIGAVSQTIVTEPSSLPRSSPSSPALDLRSCALLIAHRQDERVLIPSPLPTVKQFWHLVLSRAHQGAEAHGRHGAAACCRWEAVSPLRPTTALRSPHE